MTPQEKGEELIQKFRGAIYEGVMTAANVDLKREAYRDEQGKRCAIICVEEILDVVSNKYNEDMGSRADEGFLAFEIEFWQQVLEYLKTKQ